MRDAVSPARPLPALSLPAPGPATAALGLWLLNAFDALATAHLVEGGWAAESNPLMAAALSLGPAPFIALKLLAGTAACLVLARTGSPSLSRVGVPALVALYCATAAVHLGWIWRLAPWA